MINWIHELHQKYGPVVRYAPNELSFIDPGIWKDVYGHRATDFTKQYAFYGSDPFGHPPGLIRSDNIAHARQRKLVSHAFSDKALRDQEQILKGYARLLISKLKETVARDGKADLVNWYNFTTFDIMADLTFGEPLKLLQDSEYSPWVKSLIDNIKMIMFMNIVRRWQLLDSLLQRFIPAKLKQQRKVHMEHSIDRVDKRLARTTDRPDIWTYVMRHSESEETKGKGLLETEMYSNAALFMLAGTETTATELSGLTYNLLKNPTKLARLQNEIRSAFSSLDDIHMNNLAQLEYLNACVEEGLRIYPPVPVGLPRTTPKGGARVNGHWVPGGVSRVSRSTFYSCDTDGYRRRSRFPNMRRTTPPQTSRTRMTLCPSGGCPRDSKSTDPIAARSSIRFHSDREIVWGKSKFDKCLASERR